MVLIALVSAKHSPGVTTTALALAVTWPRPVLLIEADPAGGDICSGYLQGDMPSSGGLVDLLLAARRSGAPADPRQWSLPLNPEGQALLLPGFADPGQAAAAAASWPAVIAGLQSLPDHDIVIDGGRLGSVGAPTDLLSAADVIALVLRPTLGGVHHARSRLRALRTAIATHRAGPAVGIVLVGERPYTAREVATALEVTVLGVLPHDPRAATVLSGGGSARGLDRSPLLRSARSLGDSLRTAVNGSGRRGAPMPAVVAGVGRTRR